MAVRGYYRHPTIHRNEVVFVAEDDLWTVTTEGGEAHRLTANPGTEIYPRFSPDGSQIAFVGRDEGRLDVFVMPSRGGPTRRLTYFGTNTQVIGWEPDGGAVVVCTDSGQPFEGWSHGWSVPLDGSAPIRHPWGPTRGITYQRNGPGLAIARNSGDPARWKRYRGGRAGSIWIDRNGDGEFEELIRLAGNLANPMWIGARVFFVSDHEGVGNLYSVTPSGGGLRQHTRHREYYARFASSDGRRVVYHCGADLWLFDPAGDRSERIDTVLPSSRPQRSRRFVAPGKLIETVALHPQGHSLAITARGGAYTMPLWEGAPRRHGPVSIARQRLAAWLADGERMATVSDAGGEEEIVIRAVGGKGGKDRTISGDHGRIRTLHPSPSGPDRIAVTNHRHELILIDVDRRAETVVHRSPYTWIAGVDWSPDGRWLAFAAATTRTTMSLFLYDADGGDLTAIGRSDFTDFRPSFDPEGRYLAFLSARAFDPIPDGLFHDYGFPRAVLPMLVTLQAATPSAFAVAAREPRPPGPPAPKDPAKAGETEKVSGIDLEEIAARVEAFPVPAAAYVQVEMARGRAYLLSMPLVPPPRGVNPDPPGGRLESWDFATDKLEPVAEGVTGFTISADGKVLAIRANGRLRVIPVGSKEEKENDKPGRDTGLVDLDRIRIEVNPGAEWQQMFREAWRLQRDHYWYEDLGGVDWEEVHDRYQPLVERVASRAEFSDLMWEMQGELGTSHAYELGGDYRPPPVWTQGQLGADLRFERGAWRVDRIPVGDEWNPGASSPLVGPGLDVREGDRIVAVDGREVSATISPQSLLVERASRPVTLTVKRGRDPARDVVVTPLTDEFPLRYRDWVESNREWVSELSEGKAGYIHIPDMGAPGFAEFHRYWKASVDSPGLVIDVRFNSGGNVSQLLMEKLIRRRIGYRITRWRQPYAFPTDAPAGPMVCVTNEDSGSDGDIFSHTFKMLGLGPLIGTRTWGGVVGIWPQQSLVDGTVTTQPEFATWFTDVGYGVENYGTEPDIEVVIRPQDYGAGFDPQLERGVEELLKLIEEAPPLVPELGERPLVRFPREPKNRRRSR